MTRSIRLLGGMALLFSFTLVGCDDGTIPPLPEDSGVTPTLDSGQTDAGPPEAMCDNSVRDGDETGIDCGGSCPACDDGSPCNGVDHISRPGHGVAHGPARRNGWTGDATRGNSTARSTNHPRDAGLFTT